MLGGGQKKALPLNIYGAEAPQGYLRPGYGDVLLKCLGRGFPGVVPVGWRSRFRLEARLPAVDPFGPTAGAACEPPGEPVDALPRPLARIASACWTTLDHELTTFINYILSAQCGMDGEGHRERVAVVPRGTSNYIVS